MTQPTRHRQPAPAIVAVVIAAAVVVLQALLVPLFSAPAANIEPRDLPIVVAGPAPAAGGLASQLEAARPGAFEITTLPDATAADQALRDREAYAAFVVGADGMALHTATAASPTVATMLTQASAQMNGGQPVRTVEVVPLDTDDPRGAGFTGGFLPLAMTSMIAGVGLILALRSRRALLLGLLAYGLFAGLGAAAVLQYWLGVLPGDYAPNAAALGLIALAISAAVAGLGAFLGRAGMALGALVVFMVGNALSGLNAAPELLPQPWGTVGQWLPIGAGGTLLRSTAYFDGAGAASAVAILTGYAVVGLALAWLGRTAARPGTTPAAPAPATDSTLVAA